MAEQLSFLDDPPEDTTRITFQQAVDPVWTEHKAKLIERYLYYFVLITKHGNYVDGFAGPQKTDMPDRWAAKRVLESEPRWLRKFFLFEENKRQVERLEALRDAQPEPPPDRPRTIEIFPGDFNERVYEILMPERIRETEATFCLLDQRTFECQWATVEVLAGHKKNGNKIELFYFFPQGWIDRAISMLRDQSVVDAWWGNGDWQYMLSRSPYARADLMRKRFKEELGYRHVYSWPIYSREDGGRIMYFMVHASDHDQAPKLMYRAYRKATEPKESQEQMDILFRDYDI